MEEKSIEEIAREVLKKIIVPKNIMLVMTTNIKIMPGYYTPVKGNLVITEKEIFLIEFGSFTKWDKNTLCIDSKVYDLMHSIVYSDS